MSGNPEFAHSYSVDESDLQPRGVKIVNFGAYDRVKKLIKNQIRKMAYQVKCGGCSIESWLCLSTFMMLLGMSYQVDRLVVDY